MSSINLATIDFCPRGGSALLQAKTDEMLLTETTKTITAGSGFDGLSSVTVTHAPVQENASETITTNGEHIIIPGDGYDAMMQATVTVNVTSAVDANIVPENIRSGVTILGVTGTYTGE